MTQYLLCYRFILFMFPGNHCSASLTWFCRFFAWESIRRLSANFPTTRPFSFQTFILYFCLFHLFPVA